MAHGTRYQYGKGCRCPECAEAQNTYVREWMRTSKGQAVRDRAYAKRRTLIDELKSKPCADCGGTFPPYCMDFDHLGDKEFNIGTGNRISMRLLMAEIEKCDVVCATCHRMRTHDRLSPTIDINQLLLPLLGKTSQQSPVPQEERQ